MEKLKVALEKARDMRAEAVTAPAHAPRAPQPRSEILAPPRGSAAASWTALRPLQLDETVLKKKRVVAFKGGVETTNFDVLRTKALQMMAANGWKRLAITSPGAGSGKTTLTANLAASISRHPEVTAVLMDMDMRRPSLGSVLGMVDKSPDAASTSDVLSGKVPFAEQAWRIGENLAVSVNARPTRHSAEILHSRQASDVLNAIQESYAPTIMIFDMPPLLVGDDTLGFMAQVDCALLIAEYNVSTVDQIDQCERALAERTNVLGVVLNKSRFNEEEYGYGYGHY